jgi:hypothetical protein
MRSAICTLFESHYHYGVVALVNSLYKNGFKGDVYAGYRGNLPDWARVDKQSEFEDVKIETFFVNEDIRIHFIALKTNYHLTNYKPDFMNWLLDGPAKGTENIFYFDPDIVINYKWAFFEEWTGYGIAVCEDVNSPLPINHPRRMSWCKYFNSFGIPLKFNQIAYANGGFIGLNNKDRCFILSWITAQEKIAPIIGGLDRSAFPGTGYLSEENLGNYAPFNRTDQDALNVTIGMWNGVVSFVGKEGMAITSGAELMFHALGSPKPWKKSFIKSMLIGYPPSRTDKAFWQSVGAPIKCYSEWQIKFSLLSIKICSFIGRFYGRN